MLFLGIIFTLFGITILYWINRRIFTKHSVGGIEEFKSYENAPLIKFFERYRNWLTYIFIRLGIIYFWRYSDNKNVHKKQPHDN